LTKSEKQEEREGISKMDYESEECVDVTREGIVFGGGVAHGLDDEGG
jgi:hypothetical protein